MICNFLNIILVIVCLCNICIINKSYVIQRYNLCNISATLGIYEITSNCSLTSEITLTSTQYQLIHSKLLALEHNDNNIIK